VIVGNYIVAAIVFGLGLFLVVAQRNLVKIVMGLSLMESSTYLLLISLAYRRGSTAPVLAGRPKGTSQHALVNGDVADPVLQNFCITAIVIGVAVTGVFLAVVVRLAQHYRTVDADSVRELRG
jgi:multicomponent Na+:H+ antiporter subunit C